MAETAMKLSKNEQHYTDLVEAFFKDSAYANVDDSEKKKFLQLCVVNKLNPFKKQVYAVPYGKKLQITVAYTTYLEIAEQSGLLAGWTVLLKKKDGKVVSGKITIHRKDRNHAFEYEADVEDFAVPTNGLWKSKTEAMMRKQLIRVGFSLCFPENCKLLEVEEPEVVVEPAEVINDKHDDAGPTGEAGQVGDAGVEIVTENNVVIPPVSQEQEDLIDRFSVMLVDFQAVPLKLPENYEAAEILIRSLQFQIGKLYIKDNKLQNMTRDDIDYVFVGTDPDVVNVKKAAIKHYNSLHPATPIM